MTLDWILASAHHVAFLVLVVSLAAEWALMRASKSEATVRLLGAFDVAYGVSAGLVLAVGLSRAVWGVKSWAFYSGNPAFWLKLSTFAVIGLISIAPTVRFIQWRRALNAGLGLPSEAQWQSVRRWVGVQLALIPVVVVSAAAMARGIGH